MLEEADQVILCVLEDSQASPPTGDVSRNPVTEKGLLISDMLVPVSASLTLIIILFPERVEGIDQL